MAQGPGGWVLPGSGLGMNKVWSELGKAGQQGRKAREARGSVRTYSRSSKLDFLSSALWGMSLKNRLEREKLRTG